MGETKGKDLPMQNSACVGKQKLTWQFVELPTRTSIPSSRAVEVHVLIWRIAHRSACVALHISLTKPRRPGSRIRARCNSQRLSPPDATELSARLKAGAQDLSNVHARLARHRASCAATKVRPHWAKKRAKHRIAVALEQRRPYRQRAPQAHDVWPQARVRAGVSLCRKSRRRS